MTNTDLATRLRDLSECLWWDMGYEENHTHKDDRALLVEAADRIDKLEAVLDEVIEGVAAVRAGRATE